LGELKLDLAEMEHLSQWRAMHKIKSFRGYVPQDDVVCGDLTVSENLKLSALLKYTTNRNIANQVVQYTMSHLGLLPLKDVIVGSVENRGISGGQRKRVNIGLEVVHMPTLLIMDEPTSGLDATGCQTLIEFSKHLCHHLGTTIVSVVHQPRYTSFILFDHVVLLTKHGTIYEGHPATSLIYFSQGLSINIDKNENPADVLMDIISGKGEHSQDKLVDIWRNGYQGSVSGVEWVRQCIAQYPLLPVMLDKSITYDDATMCIVDMILESLQSQNETLDDMFKILQLDGSCVKDLNIQKFKKVMHETCSKAFCDEQYSNVIERLTLFTQTPKSIMQKYSESQITRHIQLAYCFIRKLKKKRVPVDEHNLYLTRTELLLFSMMAKAFYNEYTDHDDFDDLNISASDTNSPQWYNKLFIIAYRKVLLIWRSPWPLQLLIPVIAAIIIGNIQGMDSPIVIVPNNIIYAMVALGVLSTITHVRTFSTDKLVIRRETDNKVSIFPYIIAYWIVDFYH
jgi:ABC-type multidrug transport system ATPase subunit